MIETHSIHITYLPTYYPTITPFFYISYLLSIPILLYSKSTYSIILWLFSFYFFLIFFFFLASSCRVHQQSRKKKIREFYPAVPPQLAKLCALHDGESSVACDWNLEPDHTEFASLFRAIIQGHTVHHGYGTLR